MKVVHFHRAKGCGISIERLFEHIRSVLPLDVAVEVRYLPCGATDPFSLIRNLWFAFRNQGDVNHITGDCHYIALAMNPLKTILTIHDCVSLHRLKGLKRLIFKTFWYDWPCRWVRVITVISSFSKHELLEQVKVPEKKVEIIHNCVDPAFKKTAPQKKYGYPVVLQLGTKVNKNLFRIAESLQGLECHLRIVGKLSREQLKTLKNFGVNYSVVHGISDEALLEEFKQCDLLVFASTFEGFGLPVIEAQAVGRPVITSNIEPMVSVAGDGALLVDPFSCQQIKAAVVALLSDENLRRILVEKGFQNAARFSAEDIAREYSLIYERIVSG